MNKLIYKDEGKKVYKNGKNDYTIICGDTTVFLIGKKLDWKGYICPEKEEVGEKSVPIDEGVILDKNGNPIVEEENG